MATIKYNVYYATSPDGPWTLANSTPIDHIQSGNAFTVEGLAKGTNYFFTVVAGTVENGEFFPRVSQPVGPGASPAKTVGATRPKMIRSKEYLIKLISDGVLGHSFNFGINGDSPLGHSLDINSISTSESLGHQFVGVLAGNGAMGTQFQISSINASGSLGHQADVFIPPLVIAIENFEAFDGPWPIVNPRTATLGFTPTDGRLLVCVMAFEGTWNLSTGSNVITQTGVTWASRRKQHNRDPSGGGGGIDIQRGVVGAGASTGISIQSNSPFVARGSYAIYELSGIGDPDAGFDNAIYRRGADGMDVTRGTGDALVIMGQWNSQSGPHGTGSMSPSGWIDDHHGANIPDVNSQQYATSHKFYTGVGSGTENAGWNDIPSDYLTQGYAEFRKA